MSRFFISKDQISGDVIKIEGKEAHHILDVMRLRVSDGIVAFDGTGREYIGRIKDCRNKSVTIEVLEERRDASSVLCRSVLIQAIPKKEKMDYIVEKSTELGVSRIIPVITERTVPDWDDRKKAAAVQRWRKIVLEASKQCGRSDVPIVEDLDALASVLKRKVADISLIAALDDSAVRLKDALSGMAAGSIAIAIGPEGDFTPAEVEAARASEYSLVSLGKRVLKSDTAGLYVLSVLNYELTR